MDDPVGIEDAGVHGGDGGDGLERGAGRVLGLDGAVEERGGGVTVEDLPFVGGDGGDEDVGIEGGVGGHGDDVAVGDIENDRGGRLVGAVGEGSARRRPGIFGSMLRRTLLP